MPPMAFKGLVTRVGLMNKTATVTVSRWAVHPKTKKRIEKNKKFMTHDEQNQLQLDDVVVIRNCPPVSAMKRFKLERILKSPATERAQRHEQESKAALAAASQDATSTPEIVNQ